MKKNNFINRIFHKKEVALNKEQLSKDIQLVEFSDEFIKSLVKANDLITLMNIHKDAYGSGFTKNLGPGAMFRCSDIATMTPHQVFLGGIWGLNTNAIPFWEQYIDEPYGVNGFGIDENYSLYKIILDQYRNHLKRNIGAMVNIAKKEIKEYELCGYRLN